MSAIFNFLKMRFETGGLTAEQLRAYVPARISKTEYQQITGLKF